MEEAIETIKNDIDKLLKKTQCPSQIDTIQKVRAFKKTHEKATKAISGKNVETLQSVRAELRIFFA